VAGLRIEDVKLYGASEIRARTGWSRQWTYTLTHRRDFPPPRWKLGGRDIWWADEVEAFLDAYPGPDKD
jgi:predicted DNA-binding transcriptional regulator AlpA